MNGIMGYKTTTDPFILRAETDLTITGTSGGDSVTVATNLDTLSREVLLIWEVDIQDGSFPNAACDGLAAGATLHSLSIANSVQSEVGVLNLNDVNYIAGKDTTFVGGGAPNSYFAAIEDKNPDSRDFPSRDKVPLAIITENEIVCRSGFSSTIAFATTDTYQARFRIMAQRAKADADTYAALVTGLL